MAAITEIIHNLLLLYGHPAPSRFARNIISPLPETEPLNAIAYRLHQCGVSSIRLFVDKNDILQLNHPFLLLRTTATGVLEALHYKNGNAHVLSPSTQQTTGIDNWIKENEQAEILAFDEEALQAATLPAPVPVNIAYPLLKAGGIVLLSAVLYLWVLRVMAMPLYNQVLSFTSLLTALISLILILKETGLASNYTRPFCGKANYLGCSLLITSPLAANKWGISWAALGLVHSATSMLYILILNPLPEKQLMFTLLWQTPAIVIIAFLLYKMWKLRTFCKLCISVHVLNLLGFTIAAILFSRAPDKYIPSFTSTAVLIFAGVALLAGWLVLALYLWLHHIKKSASANAQITDLAYGLLQYNPAADEALLQRLLRTYQPLPLYTAVPEEQKPSLLIVVGLHCSHCAKLVQLLTNSRITDNWFTDLLIVADANTPAVGTQALLISLQQHADKPEARIQLLQDWYSTNEFTDNDEAAFDLQQYPFCIDTAANLIDHFPGIFIAGKKIPYPLGTDIFDLALFTRMQQLEAQETV